MMIIRAAFWISVVIVLVPRAPDPVMSIDRPAGAEMLAGFQTLVLASLARVKAELKAQRESEP